ncbi:MAG: hypothetical protein M0Q53_07345 [Prolixibacteraceae bacterium]|jgi:hypothetical protein|nr:hypothetical protein [Prolixibacteraceae bacterium]
MKPNHNHSPIQSNEDWKHRNIERTTTTHLLEEHIKECSNERKCEEFEKLKDDYNKTQYIVAEVRKKLHSEITSDTIETLENLRRFIFDCIDVIENISFIMPINCEFEENSQSFEKNISHYKQASKMLNFSLKEVEERIKKIENEQCKELPKTFSTNLTKEQLTKFRKGLIDYNLIYNCITDNEFAYIFTGKPIKGKMIPIKWKLPCGAKTATRTFIELLLPGETVRKNQVKRCFIDRDNKPIELLKPKEGEHSKYIDTFEEIIRSIKL